jgi:TetR/AcrR family transcriptional repressor of lmrAB and yxaGH operons
MSASPKHRDAIVATAAGLLRRQGYAATGVDEIASRSGAPKGSLYHYFPGGKDEIAVAAVSFAATRVTATLQRLSEQTTSTAALVKAYGRMLRDWMAQSQFRDGCPITTTLLETVPQSAALAAAGREAFGAWCAIIGRALIRDGYARAEARKLSVLVMSSLEGALILARVQGTGNAIDDVTELLVKLLRRKA